MLNGDGNKNGNKINRSNQQNKKNFARTAHFDPLFVHLFAVVLHGDYNAVLKDQTKA